MKSLVLKELKATLEEMETTFPQFPSLPVLSDLSVLSSPILPSVLASFFQRATSNSKVPFRDLGNYLVRSRTSPVTRPERKIFRSPALIVSGESDFTAVANISTRRNCNCPLFEDRD